MLTRRRLLLGSVAFTAAVPLLPVFATPPIPLTKSHALIRAAKSQIGQTVEYDSGYARIDYPDGDVPRVRGVCSDVVIRAYRDAFNIDLQRLVHEDMAAHFASYPRNWGLSRPDSNIDHRRVPNLMTFFKRKGAQLPEGTAFQPGDLVTQVVEGSLPHIIILSEDKVMGTGRLKVIHNIGGGTELADSLERFPMSGHYRYQIA